MKKTIKRILTWLLVLTLVVSVVPAAALAEEDTEHLHQETVEETEGGEPAEAPAPAEEEEETPSEPAEEIPGEDAGEEPAGEPVEEEAPAEDPMKEEPPVEDPVKEEIPAEKEVPAEEETQPSEEEIAEEDAEEEVILMAEGGLCPVPECGGQLDWNEGQKPTYTEDGWKGYWTCASCDYSTFSAIPALGEPSIETFEEFVTNLAYLESAAEAYVREVSPGKDPIALVIKYIRTGVDRYNSGSWNIMAGYEDAGFADYVRRRENQLNSNIDDVDDYFKISGLKDIKEFELPNGDGVDFGHMFGTMDISYHNKGSQNHADVAGWAGDLVDLVTAADRAYSKASTSDVHLDYTGNLEKMTLEVRNKIFLKTPCEEEKFAMTDYYGDIDGLYVTEALYDCDYEAGMMAKIIREYCTEELSDFDRADFFLKERLGNSGTRAQVRAAVYEAYVSNSVITTLESTREFLNTDASYLANLRRACCNAFADYVCSLAGDYVEAGENIYYTDFDSTMQQLAPGIVQETHYATSADNKQMVYYLATADLSNPNVSVHANYAKNDPSQGWEMTRVEDQANAAQARHSDPNVPELYVPNYQVIAAVNADGFDMGTGEPGGLLVMEGKEWHAINAAGFFGITKEGKAVIGTKDDYINKYKGQLAEGVGAFGTMLVKNGKVSITATSNYYSDRASRTAVGITKTGKVVFMVLDGRQEPFSCGGSMIEIAQIMLEAGCEYAVNLDGGGSTTFVAKPEGEDALTVISRPSDGFARSVSSTLMMVSTAPSSTAFDHAVLESDYDYATPDTPVQITAKGVSATGNVAEMPEGVSWQVSDPTWAEISATGEFVGHGYRSFEVSLLLGEEIIGTGKTMTIVEPSNVYFTRETLDAVYGAELDLPVAALFEGKKVAIKPEDVELTVSPAGAGTFDGFTFTVAEASEVKNATVTATLKSDADVSGSMTVRLFKQGENTFDFDQATAGDRQFAWLRTVSNASTGDAITYTANDRSQPMVTEYVFAMDMTQIPIPTQLNDLIYMLPGADVVEQATAWNFLLNLAERVSVLTEVHPVMKFDERFDVDYSKLEVLNEYFYMDKEKSPPVFNEKTNELTLTLYWKDQTEAIDAATANPLCMVKGIKLTPKDGTFATTERISVVNGGSIGYKIYLRANALYSFSQKPENQAKYGLMPFVNPDLESEKGGSFENIYKSFQDTYNLSYAQKIGWVHEDGGYAFYEDGKRLLGVQLVGETVEVEGVPTTKYYYYDFGEDGINNGQAKYTGTMEDEDGLHCVHQGEIVCKEWYAVGGEMYHCHEDGTAHKTKVQMTTTCTVAGYNFYTCKTCDTRARVGDRIPPGGHIWDKNFKCTVSGCGKRGTSIANAKVVLNNGEDYTYNSRGVHPALTVTVNGGLPLDYSNGSAVNSTDYSMKDLYIYWGNDNGIGRATLYINARGDYYGNRSVDYFIHPWDPSNLKASDETATSVKLSWAAASGATSYNVYQVNGDERVLLKNVASTNYTVTGLASGKDYTFMVESVAISTDGERIPYMGLNPVTVSASTEAVEATEMETVSVTGDTVKVTFNGVASELKGWTLITAAYNTFGQVIGLKTVEVTSGEMEIALQNAAAANEVVAFVLDQDGKPAMDCLPAK